MKNIILFALLAMFSLTAAAQPASRRAEQAKQTQNKAKAMTTRAQISFPTSMAMDEDVVWRRDIYRELDLTKDANAGLYYPVEPVGKQMNLFTYIFKLIMRRDITPYEYRLDGSEVFEESAKVKLLTILDDYHIFYERTDKGIKIDDSDIPSAEVKAYYIKESAYYDQASATFHKKVVALCPILKREDDDFGEAAVSYPLFWLKYDELAPFLAKHTVMTSDRNNAATMSADDFFTKNMYDGKIYKTTNMLGRTLAQYCPTDSAMAREQKRIEAELVAFEKGIWGDAARKDSLDSIAKLDPKQAKIEAKKNRRAAKDAGAAAKTSEAKAKPAKTSKPKGSSSGGSARMSVRRERH